MDELELLKKDWNKQETPSLSFDQIYRILLKKSSSIVKWIFYISIFELLLALVATAWFMFDDTYDKIEIEGYDIDAITLAFEAISMIVLVYFMFRFFNNYKKITVTDDSRTLMKNILKTRKIVKNYIKIALLIAAVYTAILLFIGTFNAPFFVEKVNGSDSVLILYIAASIVILVVTAVIIVALWLVYQLLYGLLLRRLERNYKELQQLDI
ncbi:hypothetical protein ACFQ1M_01390 [Sungkyunkwania multivorans]|uniref:Uncharacterized protein n=1 Tax=Sungkyunkwania multivorans TaxID=1173618 RepID=A0ABW3CSZ4_9FLAO